MKQVSLLAPAVFCGIIAFPCLVAAAVKEHNWPQALLCACLPGCFLFLAALLGRMNHEISRLRRRIARLEGHGSPSTSVHAASSADAYPAARADASAGP